MLLGRFGFVPQAYAGASCLRVCIPEISRVCTRAVQLHLGAEMLACNGDVACRGQFEALGPPGPGAEGLSAGGSGVPGPLLCRASALAPASSARPGFSTGAPCPLLLSASVCLDVSTPSLCLRFLKHLPARLGH